MRKRWFVAIGLVVFATVSVMAQEGAILAGKTESGSLNEIEVINPTSRPVEVEFRAALDYIRRVTRRFHREEYDQERLVHAVDTCEGYTGIPPGGARIVSGGIVMFDLHQLRKDYKRWKAWKLPCKHDPFPRSGR